MLELTSVATPAPRRPPGSMRGNAAGQMGASAGVPATVFALSVGGSVVQATLERSSDGAVRARLVHGGEQLMLSRLNVAALREMLGQLQKAMLEAEWET